jgi:carbon storage regulator
MLVLSRKRGERIVLADSVVVTVLEVRRGAVRLGIEAPPRVRIVREEIRHRDPRPSAAPVPARPGT